MVVVAGVTVVSGVEAEMTIITSGRSVLVDDVVGIGVNADVLVSFVTHCTVCEVDEPTVTVRVRATMDLANANKKNECMSIVKDVRERSQTRLYV